MHLLSWNIKERIVLSVGLVFLFVFIYFSSPQAHAVALPSGRLSSLVQISQKWQYKWGDSPRTKEGKFKWLQEDSKGWKKAEAPRTPPHRKGRNYLWLRLNLPKYKVKDPSLYIGLVFHSFQAYVEDEKIYEFGNFSPTGPPPFQGRHFHLLSLPKNFAGKTLTLRIYSDFQRIGVYGSCWLGPQEEQYRSLFFSDVDQMFLGGLFLLLGLIQFVLMIRRKGENEKIYGYFGIFSLIMGAFTLCWTDIKDILMAMPVFWLYVEYWSLFSLPAAFFAFLSATFSTVYPRVFKFLGRFHFGLACALVLASLIHSPWLVQVLPFYQILLLLYLVFIFWTVFTRFLPGELDARIFGGAFLFLSATGMVDILSYREVIPQFVLTSPWGMFVFVLSLAFILERRFTEAHALLKQYSEELEEKNIHLSRLNKAYARFVPREFLNFLGHESLIEVELGDQIEMEMTVFFSDIRSFTTLSENMTPQENFQFINDYLFRVGPAIRQSGGFIDKYIGDAIMALFPKTPTQALEAALEMGSQLEEFNRQWTEKGREPIRIGVGIHTGNLMLGIVGEEERMEGTVISDSVNLAARLEGLTKVYGATIVISEDTLTQLESPQDYLYRFLDRVKVKGKEDSVSVYEIFDNDPPSWRKVKKATRKDFERALNLYYQENFEEAYEILKKLVEKSDFDKAAHLYLQRCEYFLEHGVPPYWDGTFNFDHK